MNLNEIRNYCACGGDLSRSYNAAAGQLTREILLKYNLLSGLRRRVPAIIIMYNGMKNMINVLSLSTADSNKKLCAKWSIFFFC